MALDAVTAIAPAVVALGAKETDGTLSGWRTLKAREPSVETFPATSVWRTYKVLTPNGRSVTLATGEVHAEYEPLLNLHSKVAPPSPLKVNDGLRSSVGERALTVGADGAVVSIVTDSPAEGNERSPESALGS